MEVEDTPLFREARAIMQSGETKTNFGWRGIVHYGDGKVYTPLQVVSVNTIRDYVNHFTDEMTCTFLIPLGKYARQIYPNRNELQISLVKIPLSELTNQGDENASLEAERYSAVLIDEDRSPTDGQGAEANDEFTLDLTQIIEVHFQLVNKSLEQIRLMSVGGVWRQTKVDNMLRTVLTKEASRADVDDQRAIEGVDMVPISNQDSKEQIVITHGTKLVDVPDFMQKRYGVYNSGLGSFIQNKNWFIYPLYDTTQFPDRQKTVTIIVLPKRKFSSVERTYRSIGDSLTILMTSETAFKDDSGSQYLNEGNGARFTDPGKLFENTVTTGGNKAVMSRARNNSEVLTDQRPDGIQNVPMPADRITANPFSVFSDLSARNGGLFKGIWENSDSKLLLPGMAARILYSDQNEVKEIYGVIQGAEHVSHHHGDLNSMKYINQSVVYVFVNKLARAQA